jgi:hypothetical protein
MCANGHCLSHTAISVSDAGGKGMMSTLQIESRGAGVLPQNSVRDKTLHQVLKQEQFVKRYNELSYALPSFSREQSSR